MRVNRVESAKRNAIKQLIVVSGLLGIWILIFLATAGSITVRSGIFLGASFLNSSSGVIAQYKLNPRLLGARLKIKREGSKAWDEILMRVTNLIAIAVMPAVAGWDVSNFSESIINPGWIVVGLAILTCSTLVLNWAMAVNPHFEPTVRIQTERSHSVITQGPYKYIRHPGYLAGILYILSVPLVVGSVFAFIPIGLYIVCTILRTSLEDRTLGSELEGYAAYTKKVRYRLIPGVW